MSFEYDFYLRQHKANVAKGLEWIQENLPELLKDGYNYTWQVAFAHDRSKSDLEEYEAYDAYFYGGNRSYAVVQDFRYAWLRHIHKNPHHWQHWVLINDDPEEGELLLEIPYNYIIEMICDWWSFSWASNNLYEIFSWYEEHRDYMKIEERSRKIIEDILEQIWSKLDEMDTLQHHGVKGMKWGVRNGPPYPIDKNKKSGTLKNAAGETIIIVDRIKLNGPPNGITQAERKNGGLDRNYYDDAGKQISNNDHGKPKQHPYGEHGEHAHDYVYDEKGNLKFRTARNLTEKERKDNGDFL